MLHTYREALRLPGALAFSSTGLVARLPVAMVGLGIVILVSERTGSYALAGALSAAFQLPAALGAVITSRWADRIGQGRMLPVLVSLNAIFLVGFVVSVEYKAPVVIQGLIVAGAGVSQPAIGAMVRARWAAATAQEGTLRSAFALESIIDELVFTVGPLLTAVLAFQVALPLPLIVGAALGLVGGLLLAFQRRTQPAPTHHATTGAAGRRNVLRYPGMIFVVTAALGVGSVFGSFEVAVVAFTQEAGSPGASGIVLALWAFGSMLGGIWFGSRTWPLTLGRQMALLPAILAVALLPAPFAGSIVVLAVITTIAGGAIAPSLITSFSLTQRLVPSERLTEGLTWTNSGLAVGFSAGTAVGGVIVDGWGTGWGFAVPIAGAAIAAVVGVAGQRAFREHG